MRLRIPLRPILIDLHNERNGVYVKLREASPLHTPANDEGGGG
jgi:hypothetical protein